MSGMFRRADSAEPILKYNRIRMGEIGQWRVRGGCNCRTSAMIDQSGEFSGSISLGGSPILRGFPIFLEISENREIIYCVEGICEKALFSLA